MEHEAPAIFVALEQSSFAAAIRQSSWLYFAANVGHIVALVMFVSAVAMIDVRLLGGLSATSPGRVVTRARAVAIVALGGMALTGFMMFSADASHLAVNPALQVKFTLIAAGLANVAIYEFWGKRAVEGLGPNVSTPASAKAAGVLSLGIWLVVAACGRSIAYF